MFAIALSNPAIPAEPNIEVVVSAIGFLRLISACARILVICSGFAPSELSNCFMSMEKTTSNFLPGSELNTFALAVPLMDLILPL